VNRRSTVATLLLCGFAGAVPAAEQLRFISCPVFRDVDAGRKSGCWLADDPATGLRYDVGNSPTKPDWNHEVLVEGVVAKAQDNACGGIVLDAVRVSILPGGCTRHMLRHEGFKGRPFVLPARNTRPLYEKREPPPKPWTDRTFALQFEWDRHFAVYQLNDWEVDQAWQYISAVQPARVIIKGYAATTPTQVSGRTMAERPDVARQRAELVAESLRRLGVKPEQLQVEWHTAAEPAPIATADGLVEPSRRRAEIHVMLRQQLTAAPPR
jgi:hypothetical protein